MANSEEMGKMLGPLIHYMKKMELELTCPLCHILLRQPTVLPCTHVVCSQCVTTMDEYQYKCPLCVTAFLHQDLRPLVPMENMINIFKSLDGALGSIVQKLDHTTTNGNIQGSPGVSSITRSPIYNNTKEKSQENKFGTSGMMTEMSNKESPVSGNNCTEEKSKADNSGEGYCINREEPPTPPLFRYFKNPETNVERRSHHGVERLSAEGSPIKETEDGTCGKTQASRFPFKEKSKSDKSRTNISLSDSDDEVIEAKRQKVDIEHLSDSNSNSAATSHNKYPEGAVKCAFCHLSTITEFTGPLLHYANGKPAEPGELNRLDVKHFHVKCFEWAPNGFFMGETAMNMNGEIVRASRIECSICGKDGAAFGCYVKSCERSYHFPCAFELPGCRWDYVNYNMLCPSHFSSKFPCEVYNLKWATKGKRSLVLRDKSNSRKTAKAQIDNSSFPEPPASIPEEKCDEQWIVEPGVCGERVLCGSSLSTEDEMLLDKFVSLVGASVTRQWKPNVTHLIASTDMNGACSLRTQKFLLAILHGIWVLRIDWIKASVLAKSPVSEEAYEISLDCNGISDGPKKGRKRAIQKAPKIFTGLSFYFTDQFDPIYKGSLEELVLAAGATVIKNLDAVIEGSNANIFSLGSAFIVFNEDPPQNCKTEGGLKEVVSKRSGEVVSLQAKTGFKVVGHLLLLDHIASCSSATDLENAALQ